MALLTRPEWNGTPGEQAKARRLQKGVHEASCSIWSHPLGWELRLMIDGEHRTEAFRDDRWVIEVAKEWQTQFRAKGWTEPPGMERVH